MQVKPIHRERSLLEWYLNREAIDMDPSYQRRGDLWSAFQKRLLINSVLNEYDIPKIYLADFTYGQTALNENHKPYAVIDGKQRLQIFFDFFDNELDLDATPVILGSESVRLAGLYYRDLKTRHSALARRFEDFVPTIMSVISDRMEEIQELFIRLNMNVSISGPERRNAMPGPLPPMIRTLSLHEFFRTYATFPNSRGQDLNLAAKILLIEETGGFANMKKKDLDKFVLNNQLRSAADFEPSYQRAVDTFGRMEQVFQKKDKLLMRQAQLPVYYFLIKSYFDTRGPIIRNFLVSFEDRRLH